MLTALARFPQFRVLVVGDAMLDRYWHGTTARISPEAPVPVVSVGNDECRLGGAANVAANVAALGCQARLVGLVGDDDAARLLVSALDKAGISHSLGRTSHAPTITKLRVISRHQQLIRLDFEQRFSREQAAPVLPLTRGTLSDTDVVVFSDYAKGTLDDLEPLIAAARARKLPIVVDPKGSDFNRYRGATVLTPNQSEFEAIAGTASDEDDLVRRAEALRDRLDIDALLITRSEHGVLLVERHQPPWHLPAHAREVFDVTGAGDTVTAALGCALAAGQTLRDATALANLAAGIVVGKLGTATATAVELHQALGQQHGDFHGVMDSASMREAIDQARQLGERVAMVCDPFSPLARRHLALIDEARAHADRIVLAALSSDADLSLLAALRDVTAVFLPQDETSLNTLILESGCDVVVCDASNPSGHHRRLSAMLPRSATLVGVS